MPDLHRLCGPAPGTRGPAPSGARSRLTHFRLLAFGSRRPFREGIELRDRSPGYAEYLPTAPTQGHPTFERGNTLCAKQLDKSQRQICWKCGSHEVQFSHSNTFDKRDLTSFRESCEISDRHLIRQWKAG
jgi:hypothetical protein